MIDMPKKNTRNTRGRIISAAWKLFYENGFEDTTIEDIIYESQTSRGSFYHYFPSKNALLGTLAYIFDEKYDELKTKLTEEQPVLDQLIYLNHELFAMIEDSISRDLLASLLSTQLFAQGEKQLLDHNRTYFKLLKSIITRGRKKGELRDDMSTQEITKLYALWERALLYEWCLSGGDYSLTGYTDHLTPIFLKTISERN